MLEVLYEDNHLIAINKKSGDIVQGDKTGDPPLSDFVKTYITWSFVGTPCKRIEMQDWEKVVSRVSSSR